MKIKSFFYAGLVFGTLISWRAHAELGEHVEVVLNHVFSPPEGYDANDSEVVFVLDGMLPNSCYKVASQNAVRDPDTNHFEVHQYALKSSEGDCAPGARLPEHKSAPVPFKTEVEVGQLAQGEYTYSYLKNISSGAKATKSLKVAPVPSVVEPGARGSDSEPYAMVDNAYVTKNVNPGEPIRVMLSVLLNSSCVHMAETKVTKVGDTIVLRPNVRLTPPPCMERIQPIEVSVKVDPITEPGRYLLHVRSMNGVAQNAVFSVVDLSR